MSSYSSNSSLATSANMPITVLNEAVHEAEAVKAFNAHAERCAHCNDPFLAYETGRQLCEIGRALSGELRNAFRHQEDKLAREWPTSFHTMDVKMRSAYGPAAGIVNVMNARRTRRIMDRNGGVMPTAIPVPAPNPGPYLEVARSRRNHQRNPSELSTRSAHSSEENDSTKTYYYQNYPTYSSSFPPTSHHGSSPRQPPVPVYTTSHHQGRRADRRSVRFE